MRQGAPLALGTWALRATAVVAAAAGLAALAGAPASAVAVVVGVAILVAALVLVASRPNALENPFLVLGGFVATMLLRHGLQALLGRRRRSKGLTSLQGRDRARLLGGPPAEHRDILALKGVFQDEAHHRRYVDDGWERTQVVLRLVEDLRSRGVRRVLELGANPYMLTLLMRQRGGFEVELANYFGPGAHPEGAATHVAELSGARLEFPFRHFNMESDPFPYPAASFDCVLFCEILEHLLLSPDQAMSEIARIVRPGGYAVITTPNATRLSNLYVMALGRSVWDGYSAYGPYGRHNREYSLDEVEALFVRHGFAVEESEVRNLLDIDRRITFLQKFGPDIWYDHLFVVGRRQA